MHEICSYHLAFGATGHDLVHQPRGHLQLLELRRNMQELVSTSELSYFRIQGHIQPFLTQLRLLFWVFPRDLVSGSVGIMLEGSGEVLTFQIEMGTKATHC